MVSVTFSMPDQELAWLRGLIDQEYPGEVYLVGGALRDILLGRPRHDFDLVVPGDPRALARQAAAHLDGAWFTMDEQRLTVRIVFPRRGKPERILDIAAMQGGSLEADLRLRDFTINALALDLRQPGGLIDPLDSQDDLARKHLRLCSPRSIHDDPLRILRGIRLAVELGYRLVPDTLAGMRPCIPELSRISAERIRDELFRMLDNPKPSAALRAMQTMGVLDILMPDIARLRDQRQGPPHIWNVWDHTLAVMDNLESLLHYLCGEYPGEGAGSLWLGMAVGALGRFRPELAKMLAASLNPHRSRRSLLFFAALLHDAGKPLAFSEDERGVHFHRHEHESSAIASRFGRMFALSNEEIDHLTLLTRHHMRIHSLASTGQSINNRVVHRYFRATGAAGIELCLLSLADTLATYGPTIAAERWQQELNICRALMEAWWGRQEEVISPKPFLNGRDLMMSLDVRPGPRLGALLRELVEAQAAAEVLDSHQALGFAKQWLADHTEE